MSENSSRLAGLSIEQKRAALAQLLQKKSAGTPIKYPLSYGQRALFYLYRLAPESPVYNTAFTVSIRSDLDVPLLRRAFQALVERHPILRTTYCTRGNESFQEVHRQAEVNFEEIDASTWTPEILESRLLEEGRRPFDLERGPVMRVRLLSRSAKDHILLLTVHHIAFDYWSFVVLVDDLRNLYSAFLSGGRPNLPELNLEYTDYVRRQQKMLAGAEGERLWNYWQRQLAGELPVLNLPTDRPRPASQTFNGAVYDFLLEDELLQRLQSLAKSQGVTLYVLMLAAFQVLLHRYTGQEDILVASPTAGRNSTEFEDIIGYFVNPVVLRTNFSGDPRYRDFLGQVRDKVLDALDHQNYPFPLLVEKLALERDPSRSPVCDVLFGWDKPHRLEGRARPMFTPDASRSGPEENGLQLETAAIEQLGAPYDLMLMVFESQKAISASLQYNTDLFDAGTIRRMHGHYKTLLEGIIANPDRRVSELPLLAAEERHQLLVEWNNSGTDYPKDRCIHQLFEAQAEDTPDAIAVVFQEKHITYGELNRRANQLAHYLRRLGVGPGALVGVCVERSLEMVVGLLGILKAGGTYVPLDPDYPEERLTFMLEDTATPVLLAQEGLTDKLTQHSARLLCLDRDWEKIERESTGNPVCTTTAEDLAYVIYTSGSTGRPKGVCVPHRGVVRLVTETNYVEFSQDDVFLQFAPISFDASTFEIWGCLLNGARLVVFPPLPPSLDALGEILRRYKVTILWLTAGLFHLMVDEHLDDLRGVRQLLAGGDVLSVAHVEKVLRNLEGCTLINGYGPTESTTFTCCYRMTEPDQIGTSISIGRPVSNTQVYLLDRHLRPVPIGVAGELHIGGAGLARGYLNQPDLTAEKFIENPFSTETGARLYKTGDLARYLPDGNIEFLGRIDHQVKIRGFRIELGEIEAVLVEHPRVEQVVVTAREDVTGEKRLVAYVVTGRGQALTVSEMRSYLQQKLPDYMVPQALVTLEELPLTPNGKVDRRALPCPDLARPDLESRYVAPQTEMERAIAQIWKEALRVEKVGLHDNFFDLGGHSLLVTQVHSRLREVIAQEVSVVDLFKYPTVSSLAGRLGQGQAEAPSFQEVHDRVQKQKEAINRKRQLMKQRRSVHG